MRRSQDTAPRESRGGWRGHRAAVASDASGADLVELGGASERHLEPRDRRSVTRAKAVRRNEGGQPLFLKAAQMPDGIN
ncbi:MAG: hypothetical protein ABTD50_16720 [Polyangiaceae bacterium]